MLFLSIVQKTLSDKIALHTALASSQITECFNEDRWNKIGRKADGLSLLVFLSKKRPVIGELLVEHGEWLELIPYPLIGVPYIHKDGIVPSIANDASRGMFILPPFVALRFELDQRSIEVVNDWIGLGRVFVYEDSDFLLVSNRVSLIHRFLCKGRSLDLNAIAGFVAAGWFMSESTPIEGVKLLPPRSVLRVKSLTDGNLNIEIKSAGAELFEFESSRLSEETVTKTASHLVSIAEQIGNFIGSCVSIGLSGGRDSRLIAASFIAAGVDVELRTIPNFPREVALVQELVKRANVQPFHRVAASGLQQQTITPAWPSAQKLVRYSDGMFEPTYINVKDVASLEEPGEGTSPVVSGACGELAHGHYYPKWSSEKLNSASTDQAVSTLERRLLWTGCGSRRGNLEVAQRVRECLAAGERAGFPGIRALDWFYLRERQRRWSGVGLKPCQFAPMASIEFARAAFSLSIDEVICSQLHREITAHLIPSWRDVPYFKASTEEAPKINRPRLNMDEETKARIIQSSVLRELIDRRELIGALRVLEDDWRPRHDAILKRALWAVAIAEHFEKGPVRSGFLREVIKRAANALELLRGLD